MLSLCSSAISASNDGQTIVNMVAALSFERHAYQTYYIHKFNEEVRPNETKTYKEHEDKTEKQYELLHQNTLTLANGKLYAV